MNTAIAVTVLMAFCLIGTALSAKQMKDSSPNLDYRQLGADWPGTCQSGQVQSPINVVVADLAPIKSPAGMVKIESLGVVSGASVFATGKLTHVEMEWKQFVTPPKASVPATMDGDIFAPALGEVNPNELRQVAIEAAQCHFHTPSENAIDGNLGDGVIHCVHFVKAGESAKCDAIKAAGGLGCPVVVSIFLTADGLSSPLDNLLVTTPKSTGEVVNAAVSRPPVRTVGHDNGMDIGGEVDLTQLLPESGEYATWPGSLTTAPCTEGILWVQLLKPLSVPQEQIDLLSDIISFATGDDCAEIRDGQCYPPRVPFNNRQLQPLNGRVLKKGIAY